MLSRPSHRHALPRRRSAEHPGFLQVRRRTLAVGAMVFAGVMTSISALPASAEVIPDDVVVAALQSVTVPRAATIPAAADIRASFGAIRYDLVQAPIPMSTPISSSFGHRSAPCAACSSDHQGVDFTPGAGYEIVAIADGTVTAVGNPSGELGVFVEITHVIGGQSVTSIYGHMQMGSMHFRVGDSITHGQHVGNVGSTGQSTGPHLHFGIRNSSGAVVDPYAWLVQHINA